MISDNDKRVLHHAYSQLCERACPVPTVIESLIRGLIGLRAQAGYDEWRSFARETATTHPIRDILHQDPLTRRSFEKPRGYAGDAVMIDYVYRHQGANGTTDVGKTILECLTSSRLAEAVRWRKGVLAAKVDEAGIRVKRPHVLALACGHLREGRICDQFQSGRIGEYIALDHDGESLNVVEREFGQLGVKTVQASVLDLPRAVPPVFSPGKRTSGFDLIYAAGLYDYLWQGAAKELTAYSFNLLRSGGRLLVANILPTVPEAGYMEAIMDWWLVYRTVDQLAAVADSIPRAEIASLNTFADPHNCIAFLELTRA